MTTILYAIIYAAVLVFLIASVARAVLYARMPIHLRWELYPVPHEAADRVKHGGSYFETGDWWSKPLHFNLWGELKSMVPEILFLKGLWEFNRKMWLRSFPFHFGLYLLIGAITLLILNALGLIFAPGLMAGALGATLHFLYTLAGFVGVVLAILGALALLLRRLGDQELKTYTTAGDLFNLAFFIVTFTFLLAGYLLSGSAFPGPLAFATGLLMFDTTLKIPGLLAAGLVLGALLAAYIPLTHMSHFIGKYFTYHSVRWDDRINVKGGKLEMKLAEYLTYRPTWAAAHMAADGTRTWAEVAMTNPAQGAKK
jgi:nitrate reductase gamma subunit